MKTAPYDNQENDLKIIIHSLFCATMKYNENYITVEKKALIFKIVDTCRVSSSRAKDYLNILESRGKITQDNETVTFRINEEKDNNLNIFK